VHLRPSSISISPCCPRLRENLVHVDDGGVKKNICNRCCKMLQGWDAGAFMRAYL
jgi:hypothetical protein